MSNSALYQIEERAGAVIVRLTDRVDVLNFSATVENIGLETAFGHSLIVDLSCVSLLQGAGIQALSELDESVKATGRQLWLCGACDAVRTRCEEHPTGKRLTFKDDIVTALSSADKAASQRQGLPPPAASESPDAQDKSFSSADMHSMMADAALLDSDSFMPSNAKESSVIAEPPSAAAAVANHAPTVSHQDTVQAEDRPAVAGETSIHPDTDSHDAESDRVSEGVPEQATASAGNASEAASNALSHAAFARLRASGKQNSRTTHGGLRIGSFVGGVLDTVMQWMSWLVGQTLLAMRYRSVKLGLLATLLIVAVNAAWQFVEPRLPVPAEEVFAEYDSLWQGIQTAQEAEGTSAEEWKQLEDKMVAVISQHPDRLERQARSSRPDLQELMWATEQFPDAFREAQDSDVPGSGQARLAIHLANAEAAIERRAELNSEGATTQSGDRIAGSLLFYLMIPVDVLIVGWLLRLLLRSHWLRRHTHHASGS